MMPLRKSLYLLTTGVGLGVVSYKPITHLSGSFINSLTLKADTSIINVETNNSLQKMRKKIYEALFRECMDRCTIVKTKLTEHYKTNVFDDLPCKKPYTTKEEEMKYIGTPEHQDSYILDDMYNIMTKYDESYMNMLRKHNDIGALKSLRDKLMQIHDYSVRYPKIQHFILDLIINKYKLV